MKGFTLWLTAAPGSSPAQLARSVEAALLERGLEVETLIEADGGPLFEPIAKTPEEKDQRVRVVGEVCHRLSRNQVVAIAAIHAPRRAVRDQVRGAFDDFVEVYVRAPKVAPKHDAERARQAPSPLPSDFEPPGQAEIEIDPEAGLETSVSRILFALESLGRVPKGAGGGYSPEEEEAIQSRLRDLGYL